MGGFDAAAHDAAVLRKPLKRGEPVGRVNSLTHAPQTHDATRADRTSQP